MRRSPRFYFLAIFLLCMALLGFALYLQTAKHLLPCPLCVVQRIVYWLIGLLALLAFVHNPARRPRRVYAGLLGVLAVIGAAVALHHAWITRHPELGGCRISPEEAFLNALPLAHWWPGMFAANGDCALVTWEFLHMGIPDWSALIFLGMTGAAVYLFLDRKSPT